MVSLIFVFLLPVSSNSCRFAYAPTLLQSRTHRQSPQFREAELVRDLLYACQGIDSGFLMYGHAAKDGGYILDAAAAGASPPQRTLALQISEVGWLYRCGARESWTNGCHMCFQRCRRLRRRVFRTDALPKRSAQCCIFPCRWLLLRVAAPSAQALQAAAPPYFCH